MLPFLGNLIFTSPLILIALAGLPVIWFLLRVTPPPPQVIAFPAIRFLEGLVPETQTPSKTPWWILLLRLVIAALVIIALSGPVHNPAQGTITSSSLRLIISNGWSAAQSWNTQINAATDLLAEAARNSRSITLYTTAPAPGQDRPEQFGPLPAADAQAILKGLAPRAWNEDLKSLQDMLANDTQNADTIWLSDGLENAGASDLVAMIAGKSSLKILRPDNAGLPVAIAPPETASTTMQADIIFPASISPGVPVSIQALARDGRILDSKKIGSVTGKNRISATLDVPEMFRNEVSQFRLGGRRGAGAVYLLDDRYQKRSVGVMAPAEDPNAAPLAEASYYIRRALEPFADLHFGTLDEILKFKPSVIILPDIAVMPPDTLETIEKYVSDGGMLLRFAGPNMAENRGNNYLLPVTLRSGGRNTDGSMSWEKPPTLKPFPPESPFYGIPVSEDVTIQQQILAQPSQELAARTWAMLEDGTPLITGVAQDKGLLVLIHTAATPDWSGLPLSGMFVNILRRLIAVSGKPDITGQNTQGYLDPLMVLDGFGMLTKPDSTVKAIEAAPDKIPAITSSHPPGFYGRGGLQVTLNTGDTIKNLKALEIVPKGGRLEFYGKRHEFHLQPYLLYAALLLLLADGLLMIAMSMAGRRWRGRFAAISLIALAGLSLAAPAYAQGTSESDIKYADGLYLAYIKSGNAGIDNNAQDGLEGLAKALSRRTSVEPDGVVGLDIENDSLLFFPLIFWPVADDAEPLSPAATAAVQFYLDHGGTIIFDTRGRSGSVRDTEDLRRLIGNLNIPALEPLPDDHVLKRSFYLFHDYPGESAGETLWVESTSVAGRDGVSSVIITSHDWGSAWAGAETVSPGLRSQRASTRQQEMAVRFGVNIVMYALTGNYKADQVHVPHILERLGQ